MGDRAAAAAPLSLHPFEKISGVQDDIPLGSGFFALGRSSEIRHQPLDFGSRHWLDQTALKEIQFLTNFFVFSDQEGHQLRSQAAAHLPQRVKQRCARLPSVRGDMSMSRTT